jgi:hypothetical protein
MTATNPGHQARRHGGFGTPLPRWARIFVASVMLTTATAALVTHDFLAMWNTEARLKLDAVRMAVAGVAFLPDAPARAMLAAAHSATLCGLSRLEVVHAEATSDRMSFEVTLHCTAPLLVLRLLGLSDVSVTATARVRPLRTPLQSGGSMVLSALRTPATPLTSLNAASSETASSKASRRTAVL